MATEVLRSPASHESEEQTVEELRAAQQCDQVRASIESMLRSGSDRIQLLQQRDVRDYMAYFSDEAMVRSGAKNAQERLKWLRETQQKYAPMLLTEAQKFNNRLMQAIEQAQAKGGLTAKNVSHLKEAIARRSGNWEQVKDFFEKSDSPDTLAAWQKNWQTVVRKIDAVRQLEAKLGRRKSALDSDAFKNGSVMDRLQYLDQVIAELNHSESGFAGLKLAAKSILSDAAANHGLARDKIAPYLAHIFSKYSGTALETFVTKTLPKHAREWIETSQLYGELRTQAAAQDVPYLEDDAFLNLTYQERRGEVAKLKAKLSSAEQTSKHPLLDELQRRVNDHDWDKARTLLTRVRTADMGQQDRKRLFGLQRMIEAHGAAEQADQAQVETNRPLDRYQQAAAKLRTALTTHATEPIRRLFERALWMSGPEELMRLRTINTGLYNIKWAVDHNFLDTDRLAGIRERKEADTQRAMEQGHNERGVANVDLSQRDTQNGANHSVFRKYEEGHRGPTYYHFGRDDINHVMEDVNARMHNSTHNYWYLLAPEDTKLEQILTWHQLGRPVVLEYMNAKRALMENSASTGVPNYYSMISSSGADLQQAA